METKCPDQGSLGYKIFRDHISDLLTIKYNSRSVGQSATQYTDLRSTHIYSVHSFTHVQYIYIQVGLHVHWAAIPCRPLTTETRPADIQPHLLEWNLVLRCCLPERTRAGSSSRYRIYWSGEGLRYSGCWMPSMFGQLFPGSLDRLCPDRFSVRPIHGMFAASSPERLVLRALADDRVISHMTWSVKPDDRPPSLVYRLSDREVWPQQESAKTRVSDRRCHVL